MAWHDAPQNASQTRLVLMLKQALITYEFSLTLSLLRVQCWAVYWIKAIPTNERVRQVDNPLFRMMQNVILTLLYHLAPKSGHRKQHRFRQAIILVIINIIICCTYFSSALITSFHEA